jgi:hypothetical protein
MSEASWRILTAVRLARPDSLWSRRTVQAIVLAVADLGDVLVLLHDADTSWTTVRGHVREWRDHRLVSRAFMEDIASRGGQTVTIGRGGRREDITESQHRLWADRTRTRVERPPTQEARPELLVRVGEVWWTYKSGRGALTNGGAPNYGTGGDEIRAHLLPAVFASRFQWSVTSESRLAGRACIVARAEARPSTDQMPMLPASFNMISGGTTFDVSIDAERGVLLGVTKVVEGSAAEIRQFIEVEFDVPLEDELFAFRSPDGSPVQRFENHVRTSGDD